MTRPGASNSIKGISDPLMMETCPVESAVARTIRPEGRMVRLRGACLAMVGLAAFLAGRSLSPRPSGLGTHESLGLPPCSMIAEVGWPCPACGLTTSFSAAARGEISLSVRAHPFGPVLFAWLLTLGSAGLIEAFTGRPIVQRLARPAWAVYFVLGGLFSGWVVKLIWGYLAGTYPLR